MRPYYKIENRVLANVCSKISIDYLLFYEIPKIVSGSVRPETYYALRPFFKK
jgi:hypothetical protein